MSWSAIQCTTEVVPAGKTRTAIAATATSRRAGLIIFLQGIGPW
ncbi:MAG TPA: hypothetical protein VGR20_14495 [Acidimicrobiia bacterium]|nr:hypothetical protein [Acidimicrobiia bacterium]